MGTLPGPQALARWMAVDPTERSAQAVGEALGVSDVTVRNWAAGVTVPAAYNRITLAALLARPGLMEIDAWMVVTGPDKRVPTVAPDAMARVIAARERWERIAEAKAPAAQDGGAP